MGIFGRKSAESDQTAVEPTAVTEVLDESTVQDDGGRFDFDSSGSDVKEVPSERPSRHDYFEEYVSPQDLASEPEEQTEEEPEVRRDRRYELLETGDIVWSWILMSIPVIGWIVALLWALGVCRKRQRRYLARAFMVLLLIAVVICLVIYAFYTLVFRLRLEDLPTVITSIYNWVWNQIAALFGNKTS